MKIFNVGNMTVEEKGNLKDYFEQMLVAQAAQQHMARFEKWEHGKVAKYWFEETDDDRTLCIQYESGVWFHYEGIDLGAEDMRVW